MKKFLLPIFFIIIPAISLYSNENKTIDDLIAYFSQYFNVSGKSEVWYQMVMAMDGCRIKINGITVELYKYDANNPNHEAFIESGKELAKKMSEAFGINVFNYVNKTFVISMNENNTETEKIVEAFKSFN